MTQPLVNLYVLVTALAQATTQQPAPAVPFGVGERLTYDVKFGPIKAGRGSMEVASIDTVRGRHVWKTVFRVRGGRFFYRVNDVMESYIDTATFSSLRFVQDFEEGRRDRETRYEIFPERAEYFENDKPPVPSVNDPLDDAAFMYFVRTIPLEIGVTYEFNRYFKPDRNPVKIRVLRRERVTVPAGTFQTIVVQPIIKAKGIFSENGQAQLWLSEDSSRVMVQLKTNLSFGSLNLYLTSIRRPPAAAPDTSAKPPSPPASITKVPHDLW
jgi:hypothetical protein